jgi:ABC-2 type transport system ATP-binding protein
MRDHLEARDIYRVAAAQGVQIRRMNQRRDSLEDIFLKAMENEAGRPEYVSL